MPKDYHCILKDPHEQYLADIAQKMWEDAGLSGPASHYESKAMRKALAVAHKEMFPEKYTK